MHILGIHLDFPHIRASLVRKRRQKGRQTIEILSLKSDSEPPYPNVKPLYIKKFSGRIVSAISAKDSLIRSMELKVSRHIEEAIAFQSEATTHLNPEEILTVPLLKKKGKGATEALLFTVLRERMKTHLDALKEYEIDPDRVSSVSVALCSFVRWKFPDLLNAFIVDLGSSETSCVLMENGELKKAHGISIGIDTILDAFFEDRKKVLLRNEIEAAAQQIDLLLLKPGLNPNLSGHLNLLKQEIGKVYFSFCRDAQFDVIFTGRSDTFIHLREFLTDFQATKWPLTFEEQKFAIPLGLTLEQTVSQPLQFRREEFFPAKNWQRMGFCAIVLFSLSFLLSAALLGFGYAASKERKMEMLHSIGISQSGNIEDQINDWIVSVESNNKEYPYIPQAPKATEVLSWLSAHPLLNQLKEEGDPIEIKEIHYELVSFPKIDHSKEPYLAKVEIEFKFDSAMNGRRFHEALRNGDDLVNPQLEITWDALHDGYRASFFLKNRSPYVP